MARLADLEVIGPVQAEKLVRKMRTADQVAEWIKQAKSLPRLIEY